MNLPRIGLCPILLALLITALGCGSDATAPEPGGVLNGTVTDAAGDPVAGANINFGYELSFEPIEGGAGIHDAATTTPRNGKLEVLDHLGGLIRVIEFTAETFDIFWDGTDDSGRPVPTSVYQYRLTFYEDELGEGSVQEKWILIAINNPARQADTWISQTDTQGRFTIPVERIPIWEDYDLKTQDADGTTGMKITLSRSVTVYAFHPGIGAPHAQTEVVFEDPKADVSVALTLSD